MFKVLILTPSQGSSTSLRTIAELRDSNRGNHGKILAAQPPIPMAYLLSALAF